MEFKLIIKKLDGTLTEKEQAIFEQWYAESEVHRTYFARVKKNYDEGPDLNRVDVKKGWGAISSKIRKKRSGNLWRYAAAIAALISLGGLAFLYQKDKTPDEKGVPVERATSIQIGTDKATLTLEDGSQIALEKGKVYKTEKASSDGEKLTYKAGAVGKVETIAHNILTIPRGGQFFIALADGTRVWLNSESQLRYPVAFSGNGPRVVELRYGEAYFEVSPAAVNKGAHFLVKTNGQEIDVLGTEFNLSAYKGEASVVTTLVEGKVRIKNGATFKNLSPGLQSRLSITTNEIDIVKVDVYNEISWKNGFFSFEKKSLEDIMKVLSRWYDADVVFKDESIKHMTFNGVFRKSQSLSEILGTIENTKEVTYMMNQKTITMEKNR